MTYILVLPTEEEEIWIATEMLRMKGIKISNVRIVKRSNLEDGVIQHTKDGYDVFEDVIDGRRALRLVPKNEPRRRRKTKRLPPDVDSGDTKTNN